MKKRKMLKVRRKRVLAGILCATLFVSETLITGFCSYAVEAESAVAIGVTEDVETEEIEKGTVAEQSEESHAEAEDSISNGEPKESTDGENNKNPDGQQDKEEGTDGEETKRGEEIPPEKQDNPALGGEDTDSKEESDIENTEKDSAGENSDQNGDGMPSVSENTESAEDENAVAGVDNALTTSADDIASGIVDESYGYIEWVIDKNGKLTVSGWGDYATYFGEGVAPWYSYRDSIKSAEVNVSRMTVAARMFEDCTKMSSIDLTHFDSSSLDSTNSMFSECNSLKSIDLSGWDTRNMTDTVLMFQGCSSLKSIDLSSWDTRNVTNIGGMFLYCSGLESIDLNGWDTGSVTDMSNMFGGCCCLKSIDLGVFDTRNVTNMNGMFSGCEALSNMDLSAWDTSNVTDMSWMFSGCEKLSSINLSGWDTGNVTNMNGMFKYCNRLDSIDLGSFDARNVTSMEEMFDGFLGNNILMTIYTPYNVNVTYKLPVASSSDIWYRSDGITVTELPQNLNYSVALGRNYIPTEKRNDIYIDEESNHKYQLFDTSMEWEKAKEYCEGLDGHLVTITSEKEQEFVTEIAKKSKKKNIWLGAEMVSGEFSWITGEKFEYTNWNRGEPNNVNNNQNTIMMYTYSGTNNDGYSITPGVWNDESKQGRNWSGYTVDDTGFICEWDPVEDITENDITINGKGYAYANFILKNNNGKVQRNAKITYSIDGNSYEAVSDRNGLIAIKSPLLENKTGKNEQKSIKVNNMILHYASKQTEPLSYSVTMDVTVSPLSFTQKWELGAEGSITGGVSGGAGVTVGVAQVEACLAKAEISGTAGGTLSVEHSFEDGARSLTLLQNYESKVAAKGKMGPAAKAGVLGQDLDIDIVTAGAGVASGQSVGIGLKLDHYDPNDMGQIADIGTFMLGSQAQAGGDMMILQLAERAGFDFWNLERYGAKTSLENGADVGSIKFGDAAEGTLASLSAEQTIYYNLQRDKTNESKELSFGYEFGGAVNTGEISIAHMEKAFFSKSDSNKLEISAGIDGNNRVENFTVKKEEKSADGFLHEKGTVETAAVIYDREDVEQLKKNIKVIGEFLSGSTKYILGDAQQDLFKQLDNTPVKGSYSTTVADQEKQDVKLAFKLGLGLELGVGIGFEGVSSCEYETAGGIYENGKRYITNTNEIEAEVKKNSYSIEQIVGEPLKAVGERLKNYLNDNYDKIKNGVKNGYAVIKQGVLEPISQWVVHVVSLKEEKTRASAFQSYEIMAYDTEEMFGQKINGSTDADVDEYKAYTIGDPYYVYVTDESENEIVDYSDNPLILTLSYTDEMLAGADLAETEAHNLAVYMYSQEFCGYMCVGGTVDTEAKEVSVKITKPGQYILAVDSVSPTVKNITVSRDTDKPLITVEFNETSGFQMFSMKLDGEEVIGTADWSKYYNKVYNSFSYQVEKELTDGKHICAVYAVDTAGNAMDVPYETEFYIGQDPVESIILDKNKLALSVGETVTLKAKVTPDTAATSLIIWESSDTSIATVEEGLVTAIFAGECSITASAGDKSAICDIEVIAGQAGEVIASGSYENVSWQIDDSGKLTVEGSGDFANSNAVNRAPWFDYRSFIKSAEINLAGTTNASYMFNGCQNLIDIDVSNWDINGVTDMTGLFRDCGSLTSLNLSSLDVGKVINFTGFFEGCYKLSTIYSKRQIRPCSEKFGVLL